MSANGGKRGAGDMGRLEALWKWQQTKKEREKSTAPTQRTSRHPRTIATSQENLPSYMRPTIAAKSRQASRVQTTSTAKQNPSRTKRAKRAPLRPAQQERTNKVASRRTAKRRQPRSEHALPAPSKSTQTKRKQDSETPLSHRSKRRRVGRSPSVGVANVAGDTQDGPVEADEELKPDESTSNSHGHSKRISFAPADAQFTFKMSPAHIRFATPSRATPLAAITEDLSSDGDDQVDDQEVNRTFAGRTPAPERSRSLLTRISTPSAGGASSTPAAGDIPTSPGSCKYSVIHSARQKALSEKLSSAQGAEGKLAVLSQSPMVELKRRKSKRLSSAKPCLQLSSEGGEANATEHFRKLVTTNTGLLESLASKWDEVNEELTDVDEDVHGEIRSTACQARLIIAERFKQFGGLIDNSENNTGLKPVLVDDLQGFWDMIFYQVEDVLAKFDNLEKRKANGWKVEEASVKMKVKKMKTKVKKKTTAVSKFAAFRANMKTRQPDGEEAAADVLLASKNASLKKTPMARKYETADDQVKTYSLRKETMEQCFSSRLKPRRSTRNSLLPNVTPRSVQRSAPISPQNAASPELKKVRCSPALSPYLTESAIRRRSSCSPSATMVNAMLNASKSGRTTQPNSPLLSTCEEEATGSSNGFPNPVSSRKRRRSASKSLYRQVLVNFSPATAFTKLNLDTSANQTPNGPTNANQTPNGPKNTNQSPNEDGKDLMTFNSLPTTPLPSDSLPTQTPRRSTRIASRSKARVSLL